MNLKNIKRRPEIFNNITIPNYRCIISILIPRHDIVIFLKYFDRVQAVCKHLNFSNYISFVSVMFNKTFELTE